MKNFNPRTLLRALAAFLFIAIGFIVSECSDTHIDGRDKAERQPVLTDEEKKRLILLESDFHYSIAEARKQALQIAAELDAADAKKGLKSKRTISQEKSFPIPDLGVDKPSGDEPAIHIFNFSDKKGFAIISGDKRLFGRLGWSDQGIIDTDPIAPTKLTLARLARYMQFKRTEVESMRGDQYHVSLLEKLANFDADGTSKNGLGSRIACVGNRAGKTVACGDGCNKQTSTMLISTTNTTSVIVDALLKTKWGQGAPYNDLFNGACGASYGWNCGVNDNYATGCVQTSEAQVVAYFWAQGNPQGDTDWATIANTANPCYLNSTQLYKVAWLCKDIWTRYPAWEDCDKGTFTFNRSIAGLYGDEGISGAYNLNQGEWRDYNAGDLRASIMNGIPVPTQGSEHEICVMFNWGCTGDPWFMHQWVSDGILTTNVNYTYQVYPVNYSNCTWAPTYTYTVSNVTNYYTHLNYGWDGRSDGWYIEGQFGGWEINGGYQDAIFNHDDRIIAYIGKNY
jgi:hypothetical protein